MNKEMKKLKCPSVQETMFRGHKLWIGDTLLRPWIDNNKKRIEGVKENFESMSKVSGFNMVEPYNNLIELINETNDKIVEFYSKIKFEENTEFDPLRGESYKLKNYDRKLPELK